MTHCHGHYPVWFNLLVSFTSFFFVISLIVVNVPTGWSFSVPFRRRRPSMSRGTGVDRVHCSQHSVRRGWDTALSVRRPPRNNRPAPSSSLSCPLAVELSLLERDFYPILGSDDTGGAGCLAGPVVTATCCILAPSQQQQQQQQDMLTTTSSSSPSSDFKDWLANDYVPIPGVDDSKKLTPTERLRIYQEVISHPETYAWHIGQRSNQEIDDSNILIATMDSFQQSIEGLLLAGNFATKATAATTTTTTAAPTPYSLVDGQKTPKLSPNFQIPCRPWVSGDASVYTISLASILAKVTLDQMAQEWHELYPEYGFDKHKGYATPEHIESIHKHGPCPIHRLSFKALKGR
jgi:ribonuclease HII